MPSKRGQKHYGLAARRYQRAAQSKSARRAEEKRWADLAGPVEVRQAQRAESGSGEPSAPETQPVAPD